MLFEHVLTLNKKTMKTIKNTTYNGILQLLFFINNIYYNIPNKIKTMKFKITAMTAIFGILFILYVFVGCGRSDINRNVEGVTTEEVQ